MKAVIRFLALPTSSRHLLLQSALLLVVSRLTLAVLSFRVVLRLHAWVTRRGLLLSPSGSRPAEQIAWALGVAGRRVPGGRNCLVQALAGASLLLRAGHHSRLCIGVNRSSGNPLDAHAWVELDGRPIIGAVREPRYICLLSWDGGQV